MQMKKKLPINEKTLYSILWGCTVVAAGAVIILTVFAVAKRSNKAPSSLTADPSSEVSSVTSDTVPSTVGTTETAPSTAPDTSEEIDAPVLRFVLPTAGTLSKSHSIDTLSYSLTMNDYRTHRGVDLSAEIGDAVYACADGIITGVYTDPLMGQCIEITHSGGYKSLYKNLAEELPEGIVEGCTVKAGQIIAAIGESACVEIADEPHLHFELTLNGDPIDPATVLGLEG